MTLGRNWRDAVQLKQAFVGMQRYLYADTGHQSSSADPKNIAFTRILVFIAIFKRCHPHEATPTLQKCISEAFLKAVKHRPMAHT
jgi:hypothetical protein